MTASAEALGSAAVEVRVARQRQGLTAGAVLDAARRGCAPPRLLLRPVHAAHVFCAPRAPVVIDSGRGVRRGKQTRKALTDGRDLEHERSIWRALAINSRFSARPVTNPAERSVDLASPASRCCPAALFQCHFRRRPGWLWGRARLATVHFTLITYTQTPPTAARPAPAGPGAPCRA